MPNTLVQLFDPRGVERQGDLCQTCGEEPRQPNDILCPDCRTEEREQDQERNTHTHGY